MTELTLQYISDDQGKVTGVILPIELWQEIASELETSYLLRSATMKKRLLDAINRTKGISFGEVCEELGI